MAGETVLPQRSRTVGDRPAAFGNTLSPRWSIPGWYIANVTFAAMVAGDLYYTPIMPDEQTLYTDAGIRVQVIGAVASLARVGVYSDLNGLPNRLRLDLGTFATDAVTTVLTPAGIALRLNREPHWIAVVCDDVPQLRIPDETSAMVPPRSGFGSAAGVQSERIILSVPGQAALVAGGMPAQAVTPTSTEDVSPGCVTWLEDTP